MTTYLARPVHRLTEVQRRRLAKLRPFRGPATCASDPRTILNNARKRVKGYGA